jgi:hypothetical protein
LTLFLLFRYTKGTKENEIKNPGHFTHRYCLREPFTSMLSFSKKSFLGFYSGIPERIPRSPSIPRGLGISKMTQVGETRKKPVILVLFILMKRHGNPRTKTLTPNNQ